MCLLLILFVGILFVVICSVCCACLIWFLQNIDGVSFASPKDFFVLPSIVVLVFLFVTLFFRGCFEFVASCSCFDFSAQFSL